MHRGLPPIVLAAVALIGGGCATASSFTGYAAAGSAYATGIDAVLLGAERTGVDATSWRLLDGDVLANTSSEGYRALADTDRARAQVLERVRRHARLLGEYFAALEALAGSDAGTRAAGPAGRLLDAVGAAYTGLSALGDQLRANVVFPPGQAAGEPVKAIVGMLGQAALKKELAARGASIAAELALQEALLGVVADTIGHDLAISNVIAERLLVVDPLVGEPAIGDLSGWVATRQRMVLAERSIEEVRIAQGAAKTLRTRFEALMETGR